MNSTRTLRVLSAACAVALAARVGVAQAVPVVDGALDAAYGSAVATQTINTGFGDSTVGNGTSGGGSELDAAYASVQNNTLYLFFSGNFENNGNHIDIFIDDGRGGTNTISSASGGALGGMVGSVFSPNFNCTLAYDFNDYHQSYGDVLYLDTYNFINNSGGYAGSVSLTGGIGSTSSLGGVAAVGLNNTNAAGVNGNTGTAVADPSIPNAVSTGLEIGIPLSALGSPSNTNIKVLADINGGGDGYLSNQFLPGLPVGTGNVGGAGGPYSGSTSGAFNLSSLSNEYFSVAVPSISGVWIDTTGNGNWSDSTKWSGGVVPNAPGISASFAVPAGGNVNVDGAFTVGSISLNAPSSAYTIAPVDPNADVITMQNTGGADASITDFAGTHFIETNLVLNSNTDVLINNRGDVVYLYGNISGPGSLSSANPGDGQNSLLYLFGTNTYGGGTIVNSGTLQLDSPGALPANTALTMNASDVPDPTLDLFGNSISISSLKVLTGPNTTPTGAYAIIESTGGTAATITYDGSNANPSSFNGNIANFGSGIISLVINTGSFTFAGSSTMSGTTTVNAGATLTLANPTGGSLPNSAITNNGMLNINDVETITRLTNNGTINVNAGGVYKIAAGTGIYTLPTGINLAGGAIDTTDNSLVIPFTAGSDPIATIKGEIVTAFDAGAWDGPGITSSLILTTPGTALAYADGNTDTGTPAPVNSILVKIAWLGDLNLNGSVDGGDLTTLTANLGMTGNVDWRMGDLNYDGKINDDDLSLYMLGDALSGGAPLAVPEPAALAALALPLLALGRRRRIA